MFEIPLRKWLAQSKLARDATVTLLLSVVERGASLLQTVIIARALGIDQFGLYGLLYSTAGLASSVVGMQFGLAANVFVAKHIHTSPLTAFRYVRALSRYGWTVLAAACLLAPLIASSSTDLLTGSPSNYLAVLICSIYIGVTVVSGIQDGVAQGFEKFKILAVLRVAIVVISAVLMYFSAARTGINGVLTIGLIISALKILWLNHYLPKNKSESIPMDRDGILLRDLAFKFGLPTMLVSFIVGYVSWQMLFLLSQQKNGLEMVAIANAAMQWRSPVILLASSVAIVALPAFARLNNSSNPTNGFNLRNRLAKLNLVGSLLIATPIALVAERILNIYGNGFSKGSVEFAVLVVASVPTAVAGIYMQHLIAAGKLRTQVAAHLPLLCVSLVGSFTLIPKFGLSGYAATSIVGALTFLASAIGFTILRPAALRQNHDGDR